MKFSQIFSFGLCAALLLGTAACTSSDDPGKGQVEKPEYKSIELSRAEYEYVQTQNEFAKKLYVGMHNNFGTKDNLVLSPLSASMALSIAASGAAGDTRAQIIETLGFADADIDVVNSLNARLANELISVDPSTAFSLANAAWFDKSFTVKDDFLNNCRNSYGMTADCVDMHTEATRQLINKWAADNTRGLIKDLIKDVHALDGLKALMANALYFKGIWTDEFDKNLTTKAAFHNADGTESKVDMMHNSFKGIALVTENCTAVEMYLGSSNYRMVFVLPAEGHDFASVLPELEAENMPGIFVSPYDIELALPRFDITCSDMSLVNVLMAMGIRELFNSLTCDMSAMTDDPLYLDFILQSTRLTIDESGAEAAAVTMEGWYGASGTSGSLSISFDRPFGFYIYEHSTKAIIFMGDVNKL